MKRDDCTQLSGNFVFYHFYNRQFNICSFESYTYILLKRKEIVMIMKFNKIILLIVCS